MELFDKIMQVVTIIFVTFCIFNHYRRSQSLGWSLLWTLVVMNVFFNLFKDAMSWLTY